MKRLILMSDHTPEVVETLRRIGKELDLTVLADPPERLVERARREHPQLIVLDIEQKDGLELLSRLKTNLGTRTIPVIVVAGADTATTTRELAMEVGAAAFVEKPLELDFLAKLATFLDGQRK